MDRLDQYVRSFSQPDEVIEIETVRSEMILRGGTTVSHDIHQPGWRWSVHIKPIVGTEWCHIRHIGVVLAGRAHFLLADGTEFEAGPLDLIDIPADHDAWVVGDEPLEMLAWAGAKGWMAPLETLGERVLASVLFTDIVESTVVARRLGDMAWGDLLGHLELRTRDLVAQYRGRVVKSTGDGVLATFDGAARAIRCAIAIRSAARDLGLEIRAGVHTGEIEIAGSDIRGVAVHEAARILGVAGPGEILATAVTVGIAGDAAANARDLGEVELRGMGGTRRIYAVG
jgi:class 3 adenylate cyclase